MRAGGLTAQRAWPLAGRNGVDGAQGPAGGLREPGAHAAITHARASLFQVWLGSVFPCLALSTHVVVRARPHRVLVTLVYVSPLLALRVDVSIFLSLPLVLIYIPLFPHRCHSIGCFGLRLAARAARGRVCAAWSRSYFAQSYFAESAAVIFR